MIDKLLLEDGLVTFKSLSRRSQIDTDKAIRYY